MSNSKVKIGQRVTVLPAVSHRTDVGSLQDAAAAAEQLRGTLTPAEIAAIAARGASRKHLAGRKGAVVAIREDGRCLVNDQYTRGEYDAATGTWANAPTGPCNMCEWFDPTELEVG